MTVAQNSGLVISNWTGLSTDSKPTKALALVSPPLNGDLFFETDTRNFYKYSVSTDSWTLATALYDLRTLLAGERQQNSATESYSAVTRFGGRAHRIHATTAVNLSGATIGTAGAIGDTFVSAVVITSAAGPPTATLTGFLQDETPAAQTLVLTGAASGPNTVYTFDQMINYAAAASITASVADVVHVWHGAP